MMQMRALCLLVAFVVSIHSAHAQQPLPAQTAPSAATPDAMQEAMPTAPVKGRLFVNLSSSDTWRAWMALHFADNTHQLGYPTTVFLNLDAVKLAVNVDRSKLRSMRRSNLEIITQFIARGGVVLVCGPCLLELGLKVEQLIPGTQLSRPGLTQEVLFAPDTRVLSW